MDVRPKRNIERSDIFCLRLCPYTTTNDTLRHVELLTNKGPNRGDEQGNERRISAQTCANCFLVFLESLRVCGFRSRTGTPSLAPRICSEESLAFRTGFR